MSVGDALGVTMGEKNCSSSLSEDELDCSLVVGGGYYIIQ